MVERERWGSMDRSIDWTAAANDCAVVAWGVRCTFGREQVESCGVYLQHDRAHGEAGEERCASTGRVYRVYS